MTKKNRVKLALVFVVGLLNVCLFMSYYLVFKQCLPWECAPPRSFDVYEFPLPISLFPEGAVGENMFSPTALDLARNKGSMAIFWHDGNGKAIYLVWQFRTTEQASQFYQTTPMLSTPLKRIVVEVMASEYNIQCGNSEFSGYICEFDARCDEFVFHFNTTISDELTEQDFLRIISNIDSQLEDRFSICHH